MRTRLLFIRQIMPASLPGFISRQLLWSTVLMMALVACSQSNQMAGSKKKLRVAVGEIKEVTIARSGDGATELVGTSDNQEIVEVSRRELAPALDTLKRSDSSPTVFQIKGVTVGQANVVFSTKPMQATGSGTPVRTYVVQVTAK